MDVDEDLELAELAELVVDGGAGAEGGEEALAAEALAAAALAGWAWVGQGLL
jgi:hypothetical protein